MTDDDAEDGLKSLRAVWLAMPDEDPPDRGFADLMAAARVKAEVMSSPSLWQRFVDGLRRPPVLALATVMVLLGGVVLIGQRGNDMEAQAPSAEQSRSADTAVQAGEQGSTAPGPTAVAPVEEAAAPAAAPAVAPAQSDVLAEQRAKEPMKRPAPSRAKEVAATKSAPKSERDHAEPADVFEGESSTSLLGGADSNKVAVESTVKAKDETTAKTGTASAGGAKAGPSEPMTDSGPSVAQLHQDARTMAARAECDGARRIISRIAKLDAAYYKAKVVRDTALARCLPQ